MWSFIAAMEVQEMPLLVALLVYFNLLVQTLPGPSQSSPLSYVFRSSSLYEGPLYSRLCLLTHCQRWWEGYRIVLVLENVTLSCQDCQKYVLTVPRYNTVCACVQSVMTNVAVSLRGYPEAKSSRLGFFMEAESLATTQDNTQGASKTFLTTQTTLKDKHTHTHHRLDFDTARLNLSHRQIVIYIAYT